MTRYGDAIVMFIRMTKIPSHVYVKHQYMQESEHESIVVIYIPTKMGINTQLSHSVIQYYMNIISQKVQNSDYKI